MKWFVSAPAVLVTMGVMLAAGPAPAANIVVGKYFEGNATEVCQNVPICRLEFAPLPAGATVLITHVACEIRHGVSNIVRGSNFGTAAGNFTGLSRPQAIVTTRLSGAGVSNAVGATTYLLISNSVPAFEVQMSIGDLVSMSCQINGQRPSPI